MAIGEYKDESCDSSNSQPKKNGFSFNTQIEIRLRAFHVRELQREFTGITKLNGLLKKIATAMLFLNFTVASCVLVEMPLNEALMLGKDSVEFKCKSDHGYRLKWFTHQSLSIQVLFDGYSISKEAESFCSVENGEPGKFYLKLSATREAAQTYLCVEPGTNNESSADLIIIEREAQFKTDANDSHVIITCDLEYSGNWAPELEWSYNGLLITEGVNASIVLNKAVSSTLIVPVSSNNRNYTCTTRFDIRGKPQRTTSDNIPDYVSNSVLKVEASQIFSNEHEAPSSASGTSVGVVIGIIISLAITVFAVMTVVIYLRKRKKAAERSRNEESADVGEPFAA